LDVIQAGGWSDVLFARRCTSRLENTLPPSLQQLTNTDSFKRQLKTVLFEQAFFNIAEIGL